MAQGFVPYEPLHCQSYTYDLLSSQAMGKSNRAAAQRRKPYRGDPSQLPAIQVDSDAIEETCDEVRMCTICGRRIKEGQETYRHLCQHKKCGERSRSVEYTIKQQGPKAVKK